MEFVSGHLNYKIVVRRAEAIYQAGVRVGQINPLRVVFENGRFDTDAAAVRFGWTPEEKGLVETFLTNHPENGRNHGFHAVVPGSETMPDLAATAETPGGGCAFAYAEPDGQTVTRCGHPTIEASPYCQRHTEMLLVGAGAGGEADGA